MRPSLATAQPILALALTAVLAGCSLPLAKRTQAFAKCAAPTLHDEETVYRLVQTTHARRVRLERIESYDTTSILAPAPERRFASKADLEARAAILALLRKYIDGLAAVSGNAPQKHMAQAMQASAAMAADASSAKTAAPAMASAPKSPISDTDVTAAIAVIDVLGSLLEERMRARDLPAILAKADGPISQLCALLEKEIGDPQTGGLRFVLRTDFEAIESAEDAAIRDHPKEYSYPEKRAAIAALYRTFNQQAAADAELVHTRAALEALAKTHAALAASTKDKSAPSFRALLGELIQEGDQIAALISEQAAN